MTRHYATACRARELPVLLASMRRHCRPFELHVLCWDYVAPATMCDHDARVSFQTRTLFLNRHPGYAPDRLPGQPRRPVDEVVTMRWRFFADVMEATGEPLTTLDGDLWFWSSPEPMFAEIPAGAPFAACPHRIRPASAGMPGVTLETHRVYGLYNTGLTFWRERAPLLEMAALNREWSYTEVVPRPGRRPLFGDQAHFEDLAERHGAHAIAHPGVNLAPWNIHGAHLRSFTPPGGPPLPPSYPVVDHPAQPLIVYHYSSLRLNAAGEVVQLANPCYELAPWHVSLLYDPYVAALRAG